MPTLPTAIIPRNILTALRGASNHVQFSSLLLEVAQGDTEAAFRGLQTSPNGLSEEEASRRLEQYGPNVVTQEQRHGRIKLLGRASWPLMVPTAIIMAFGVWLPSGFSLMLAQLGILKTRSEGATP